jgi:hypothetical protein
VGSVGEGFAQAEGVIEGSVIHCTAPLVIFLVVQVDSHAVGLLKLRQCCGVWKTVLSLKKQCPACRIALCRSLIATRSWRILWVAGGKRKQW